MPLHQMEGGRGRGTDHFVFNRWKGKRRYSCRYLKCEVIYLNVKNLPYFQARFCLIIWYGNTCLFCLFCIYCQLWHTGLQGYCFLRSHSLPFQVLSKMSFYFWFWFPMCDILMVVLCFNKCFTYFRQFMLLFLLLLSYKLCFSICV